MQRYSFARRRVDKHKNCRKVRSFPYKCVQSVAAIQGDRYECPKTRTGRPRVTTVIQERYLRVSSLGQRFATTRLLQNQLKQTHGVQIRTQTIRNRLREYDLRLRVAARGLVLTPTHRRARLDFAREHIYWERVLFTNESRSVAQPGFFFGGGLN